MAAASSAIRTTTAVTTCMFSCLVVTKSRCVKHTSQCSDRASRGLSPHPLPPGLERPVRHGNVEVDVLLDQRTTDEQCRLDDDHATAESARRYGAEGCLQCRDRNHVDGAGEGSAERELVLTGRRVHHP